MDLFKTEEIFSIEFHLNVPENTTEYIIEEDLDSSLHKRLRGLSHFTTDDPDKQTQFQNTLCMI